MHSHSDPLTDLRHEHEAILQVVGAMEAMADGATRYGTVSGVSLELLDRFLRGFLHACHHRKEEIVLFPVMASKSPQIETGPVKVLRGEHEAGAVLMARIAEARRSQDASGLGKALAAYAQLLRRHIARENEIIFPLVNALITESERDALAEGFEEVEQALDAHALHHEMEAIAAELTRYFRVNTRAA